jgi:glutamyl/glutaminyl-tRNA synthetase
VMRGDDHISNTPKQIMLYRALGAELPEFAHLPMIHGMDGKKLSKRHGATAVADYQNEGILPGAMVNFLALMGWSPGGDREVMSLEEMIALFSLDGLQKKAAIFDTKKLEWMNGQHLSRSSALALEPRLTPALLSAGVADREMLDSRREWYLRLIDLLKVRARTLLDMVRQAAPFFPGDITYDAEAVEKQWKDREATKAVLLAVQNKLANAGGWTTEILEEALRSLAAERGVAAGKIFQPLRVALTGLTVSPGIFEVLIAMGPELTAQRLRDACEFLNAAA